MEQEHAREEELKPVHERVEQEIAPKAPITGINIRSVAILLLITLVFGLASGYLLGRKGALSSVARNLMSVPSKQANLMGQINPPNGYTVPATFGDLGPSLLASGAIDHDRFAQLYQEIGRPLTEDQLALLTKGSTAPVVINRDNAHFLLNFFWAVGLANKNKVLEEGPMKTYNNGQIGGFASTGGWTLGAKSPEALYASALMIVLTPDQQVRLEEVAASVYRPCCNNPTHFPDCNHGMAMLGLLELMASQGASVDQMFTAAKYVNAFWFPQQTLELAKFFQARQGVDFAQADARQMVGNSFSSGSGFQTAHKWLADNGLLEQSPSSGGSCGVE